MTQRTRTPNSRRSAAPPAQGRAQRADRDARRCGLCGVKSRSAAPCDTPTAERLAAGGLKLNRFHTTALCSPTRQAMLTGRNHHSVKMGGICEIATSAPGYSSRTAEEQGSAADDPQTQRLFDGAVRQVPRSAGLGDQPDGAVRPVAHRRRGFEYFYGFVGGETNQYYPAIYEGTTPIERRRPPRRATTSPRT